MKNKGLIILLLTLILLICPLAAMGEPKPETADKIQFETTINELPKDKNESIMVFSPKNKKVENIDFFEYTVGAVAAEIPPTYHTEAVKAQAVAAYTYALKVKSEGRQSELNGAHISASDEKHQGYIDKDERKKRWGEKFDIYEEKIEEAVKEVYGKRITYKGELIVAAYHAISSGSTYDSNEIWGTQLPYLKSVPSAGDRLSPDFIKTQIYSVDELKDGLKKIDGLNLTQDASNWIGETEFSDSGCTKYIEICKTKISGTDLRKALNLNSACLSIEYIDKSFKVTTKGYGHGLGMSQYGADYMARQGKKYDEILKHYYSGTEIE